jgi:peptidoglycan/LPS O-acetylase OafA/YrhL
MQQFRARAVDGLCGWAAISVVFYHSILNYDPSLVANAIAPPVWVVSPALLWSKVALSIFNGEYAVILFFIISGFVLQLSLNRLQVLDASAALQFFVKRAFRLMPSIFVAVTAAASMLLICHLLTGVRNEQLPPNLADYIKNLFLIDTKVEGVTWTGATR